MARHTSRRNAKAQRVEVAVEVVPGPYQELVAERLLRCVVETLLEMGAEPTAVRIELTGPIASW